MKFLNATGKMDLVVDRLMQDKNKILLTLTWNRNNPNDCASFWFQDKEQAQEFINKFQELLDED